MGGPLFCAKWDEIERELCFYRELAPFSEGGVLEAVNKEIFTFLHFFGVTRCVLVVTVFYTVELLINRRLDGRKFYTPFTKSILPELLCVSFKRYLSK